MEFHGPWDAREISRILEQTREIFRREQTREMLEARRSILPTHAKAGRPKDTGGATKASAEYHLPDYTEPEPSTARAPEGEGEAT